MKIITKAIENAFIKQGDTSQKSMEDINIVMKLFNPVGAQTWYLYEHIEDDIYMCFANLGDPICAELGTVSLDELMSLELPFGLKIERDMHFEPLKHNLKKVYDQVKAGGHM